MTRQPENDPRNETPSPAHGAAGSGSEPVTDEISSEQRRADRRVAPREPRGHVHHAQPLHVRMTRLLGADMRLLYGMVVPLLAVVGFIIALAISGQTWLIIGVVVFLLIALAVVLFGLMAMLGETDEDEGSST